MVFACFSPMLFRKGKITEAVGSAPEDRRPFWLGAAELALWNFLANGCANVALLFIDASRVSFLTQASIAFTPIITTISGKHVTTMAWAGSALAFAGVAILALDVKLCVPFRPACASSTQPPPARLNGSPGVTHYAHV
jgi:drug/metabolite transporter (DMT)-like permease